MRVIVAIRRGSSGIINFSIPLIILLIVFVVPAAMAAPKELLSKIVIPFAEEAPQTTIPPDLDSFATSAALPGILVASFKNHPLLGYSPTPLYSQNGGVSWQPVQTTPWEGFSKIAVAPRGDPNAPVRLLVGASSTDPAKVGVYRTGGYGKGWTFIPFGFLNSACTYGGFTEFVASPVDPKRLYLVNYCEQDIFGGYRNFLALFTSPDSGITWQAISPLPPDIGSLNITPSPSIASRVYAMGQNGHWYQSDDSGLHWSPKNFPGSPLVLDAKDPARLYGLDFDRGHRSIDEGKTWVDWAEQPCQGSSYENNQLLAHPTQSKVLLLRCASSLFRSNDGGDHWVQLSPWQGQRLEPDYGNPGRILWVRNDGLWATHNSGDTWTHLADNYQTNSVTPWQNLSTPDPVGALYAITALSPTNVWAVGADGLILRWQGQEWLPVDSPVTASLFSIAFASPNEGWAVGDQTILHWDGNAWTSVPHPAIGTLKSVDVLSANNVWAVGSGGAILHWDGQSWQGISSPTSLPLESVDMVSPVDGWAVGGLVSAPWDFTGIILRWNGVNWTPFATTSYILRSVEMLSGSEGWSVGNVSEGGTQILRWNGTSWQEFPHPNGNELASVSMISANEGWAVGGSTALHWNGQSWTSNPVSTELNPSSVTTLPTGEVWLTSHENGWLLRHQTIRELYLPQIRK